MTNYNTSQKDVFAEATRLTESFAPTSSDPLGIAGRLQDFPVFGTIAGNHCGESRENCYLYAVNFTHPYIEGYPGEFADPTTAVLDNSEREEFTENLNTMLDDDGLRQVAYASQLRVGEKLIAAYVDIEEDEPEYHFARQDRDGGWSEKQEYQAPQRVDISKLENRDDNFEFVGYFAYTNMDMADLQ